MRLYQTQFFADGPVTFHDRTKREVGPFISIGKAGESWYLAPVTIFVPKNMREAYSRACAAFNAELERALAESNAPVLQAAE